MTAVDVWVAFSETTAGGSAAGIVHHPPELSTHEMQALAVEVGAPATCFVQAVSPGEVDVRFFSTLAEYGMCGHGTIALLTALIDTERLECGTEARPLELVTPTSRATMSIQLRADGRPEVMLGLTPAPFGSTRITPHELADALGTTPDAFGSTSVEESPSDFVHLIVPTTGLDALASISPDFETLADLCRSHGVHTVAAFSPVPGDSTNTIRVRDFCPATGTDEAPATGTTNRAVSGYLARHNIHGLGESGRHTVRAEQGVEMERPSLITTAMDVANGVVSTISVGGVATLVQRASEF